MLTSCHILLTLGSIQINSNITGNLIEFKYKIRCLNTDLSYLACDPYVGKGNTKKHEKISLVKLMALYLFQSCRVICNSNKLLITNTYLWKLSTNRHKKVEETGTSRANRKDKSPNKDVSALGK